LDSGAFGDYMTGFADQFKIFADQLGDRLSRERRELYERFIDGGAVRFERYLSRRNLTVVHGDAHVWNYFMPHDGSDDVRIFDWDAWRIGLAATDLAYMMAMHWYPERRRRMERPLLDHYHEALVAAGLRGYGREALDEDYRLSVLWQIMTPVRFAAMKVPPVIWWSHLERVLLAIDDLGCRSFIL
jgi:thiamine kinase-like enzyme